MSAGSNNLSKGLNNVINNVNSCCIIFGEWQMTKLTLIYHDGFNPKTPIVICEHNDDAWSKRFKERRP